MFYVKHFFFLRFSWKCYAKDVSNWKNNSIVQIQEIGCNSKKMEKCSKKQCVSNCGGKNSWFWKLPRRWYGLEFGLISFNLNYGIEEIPLFKGILQMGLIPHLNDLRSNFFFFFHIWMVKNVWCKDLIVVCWNSDDWYWIDSNFFFFFLILKQPNAYEVEAIVDRKVQEVWFYWRFVLIWYWF